MRLTVVLVSLGLPASGVAGSLVRPLLSWRRAELALVVAAFWIELALEPSNLDHHFDRARLRKAIGSVDWFDAGRWGRSAAAPAELEDALALAARTIGE